VRIEGPVEIAFTETDPGDYGEPHLFAEEDVTFVTVPTWDLVGRLARLDEKRLARALLIAFPHLGHRLIERVPAIAKAYREDVR
jgi:hypothetical protein